jgi:hypothetical protein
MNANEEKVIRLVGSGQYVSLNEVLENLKVVKTRVDEYSIHYILTRSNKDMPWPAPYQAGDKIDGQKYHCCSYVTLEEDDIKDLRVYRIDIE